MKKLSCCALAVLVFAFSSCDVLIETDNFFSTSLAPAPSYDLSKTSINAGNVDQWLETARMNPKLAEALLDKLKGELDNPGLSSRDKATLMDAGLKLSLQTAGLGTSIITGTTGVLEKMVNAKDEDTAKELLSEIQGIFNGGKAKDAADNISSIAGAGNSIQPVNGIPQFTGAYKTYGEPSPTDVALAVVILAVDQLEDTNINDVWDKPEELAEKLGVTITEGGVALDFDSSDANKNALAAYVNLIVNGGPAYDDNPITSSIKNAFKHIPDTGSDE